MKAIDAHLRRVPALLHVVVALAAGLAATGREAVSGGI